MKQIKYLFVFLIAMLINTSCTENVINGLSTEESILVGSGDSTHQALDNVIINIDESASVHKKCLYLTIDDGPLNGAKYIDSIVSAEKVKVNLFIVGNSIHGSHKFNKYYELFRENSFIEIYNHSYSHAKNRYADYYKNPESVLDDFEKNESDFGISHKIARLPGRNLWQLGERKKNIKQTGATSTELLAENGYKIFEWDIEWEYNPKDYTPKQSIDKLITEIDSVYNSNKTFSSQHVVLLMHDQMFAKISDKNDLATLISRLKQNDYTFEYLSSYP